MPAPTIPYYGKDSDRLARLDIAHQIVMESTKVLSDWPARVTTPMTWKAQIEVYRSAYKEAIHLDRRNIAQRIAACNEAGATWQKIVNYACATEEDNTEMLERMGVLTKSRRSSTATPPAELYAPDLSVVNLDQKGVLKAACSRERRRHSHEVWVTDGDPRVEEGWYFKESFGDCTNMVMSGFQSGKEISLRCRIIGRDNKKGPWSHTITIMVT